MFSRDMGRCSDGLEEGGFVLGSRITFACFMAAGIVHSSQTFCISAIVIVSPIGPAPYSSSAVILSGPAAFFFFSLASASLMVRSSGGFAISATG